jgi:serine protease Do
MVPGKRSFIFVALSGLMGLLMLLTISPTFIQYAEASVGQAKISQESIDILFKTNQAMAEVVTAVKPAVVNIASTRTLERKGAPSPFFNDPFFRKFFGEEFGPSEKPRKFKQSGLGSGVIVDENGYILTNNHVIKDADEIVVKLSDKREFKGKVIGTDAKTDLAVIKIDSNNLPVLKLGDSDDLKVGETVLAIGNPFGLSHTVTSGIVSAKGRAQVGIADYEDFIQTDAPINPGNSGGALVNIKGELVGINTAIFSTTGGYQGIGFAIPSNMAKVVMESLIKTGKVVRGWLGVNIQPLTPDLMKQFNLKEEKGVLVGDVVENSPAEKAGVQRGDVIVEFDGKDVIDALNLRNMVANTLPGKVVMIKIVRDGKPETLRVTISETPEETQALSSKSFDNQLKGVYVQTLTPELSKSMGIPQRIKGVVITDIEEGSPAEGILGRDDVIMEINKNRIGDMKGYEAVVSKIDPAQNILLLIYRKGSTLYITLSSQ